jgi:hypothetical protein
LLFQIAQKTLKSLFVSGSHNRNIGECKAVWPQKKEKKKGGDSQKKEEKEGGDSQRKEEKQGGDLQKEEKDGGDLQKKEEKDGGDSQKKEEEKKGGDSQKEEEKEDSPKLRTAGVEFEVFWALQDKLRIRDIKSNDIHAILKTYGVEAARATIIKEVNEVFEPFGIDVNMRHLSLVADFMTSGGSYRPMSILGMAQFCTSPFGKMSFEQATRFITEAACYGEVDNLEGPSASVSLGKPAKMGTGSFGLLQNMCLDNNPQM